LKLYEKILIINSNIYFFGLKFTSRFICYNLQKVIKEEEKESRFRCFLPANG